MRRETLLLLATASLLSGQGLATSSKGGQIPAMTMGSPLGSYGLSDIEHINLYDGHLNVSIPLREIKGRGESGYMMRLTIERRWSVEQSSSPMSNPFPSSFAATPISTALLTGAVGYSPGILYAREVGDGVLDCSSFGGGTFYSRTVNRLTFLAPDGTETEFRDQLYGGAPLNNNCNTPFQQRGTTLVSVDGSAATLVLDNSLPDQRMPITWPSASFGGSFSGVLFWRDGTRYRLDNNGHVVSITDRHGNLTTLTYDSSGRVTLINDAINRQTAISYHQAGVYPAHDTIQFQGFGGAVRQIVVDFNTANNALKTGLSPSTYSQLFGLSGDPASQLTFEVVTGMHLPNGQQYQFFYNQYAELARMTLPTFGTVEYDFGPGRPSGGASGLISGTISSGTQYEIYRRLTERRLYTTPSSSVSSTPESRTDYTPNYFTSGINAPYTTVDVNVMDSGGNLYTSKRHYLFGNPSVITAYFPSSFGYAPWNEGREFQTDHKDTTGTTLRTETVSWQQRADIPWWTNGTATEPELDPRIMNATTTLDNNLVSFQSYVYDQYNNRTDVFENDYGQGSPGSLLRHTKRAYVVTNQGVDYTSPSGPHLRSLPASEVINAVNSGAETMVAQTTYTYDTLPLTPRPGLAGADPNFGTTYLTRGNRNQTTRLLVSSISQNVITRFSYDVAGNIVSVTDPNGNPTTYGFSDDFGAPDGDATTNTAPQPLAGFSAFAFPTSVTNSLGQKTLAQYDYYIGKVVDEQDVNGTLSSHYYNDPLERPTQTIIATNRPVKSQTTLVYKDMANTVTSTSDQTSFGDNNLRSDTIYDGIARPQEVHQFENSSSYITQGKRVYDAGGRVYLEYNPYRSSDTPVATQTVYDGVDRPKTVTATDGAPTQIQYLGNQKTVIDPAGAMLASQSDALGRLTQVTEFPGDGTSFNTNYFWDALDDLLQVSQGSAQRSFAYDSLKRLTSATTPESGTETYSHDFNGNVTARTDARFITTSFVYDALNRPISRKYSDNGVTPQVLYTYDDPTVPFSIGRLTKASSSASTRQILQYDPLGRVLQDTQSTGVQSYSLSYTYNLAGALLSETYPSGRIVSMTYDQANRVTGTEGVSGTVTQAYAFGIQYTPHGAVQLLELGNGLWEKTAFNARLQPTSIGLGPTNQPNDSSIVGLAYTYQTPTNSVSDNNGNVRSHTITAPNLLYPLVQTYEYDGLNRLTGANEVAFNIMTWQQGYAYDRNGNRAVLPTSTYIPSPAMTPQSLSSYSTTTNQWTAMSYDAAGDIISDSIRSFNYDAEGRQTAVFVPSQGTSSSPCLNHLFFGWSD